MFKLIFIAAMTRVVAYVNVYVPGKTLVIQYGRPRTATTLQYTIAIHMAYLKHREFDIEPPIQGFKDPIASEDLKGSGVLKTHDRNFFDLVEDTNISVMLLATATRFNIEYEDYAAYIQYKEQVEENPLSVIDDYAKLFNLTNAQKELTRAFIKFWDLYRLCCGTQQSVAHRLHLHGCPPLRPWFDVKTPHCEIYNLTAVEEIMYFSANAVGDQPFVDPILAEDQKGPPQIGTCVKVEEKIEAGLEFNDGEFIDCPTVVKKWAPSEYDYYVCRYGYVKNEKDCTTVSLQ